MRTYYEINPENNQVMYVEELSETTIIKSHHGFAEQQCSIENENNIIHYHGKINLEDGTYDKDLSNNDPIIINGVSHPLDENQEVIIRKTEPLPTISNEQIAQEISDLKADLIIAGIL